MYISGVTPSAVAAQVWQNALRDLTQPTQSDSAGPTRTNITPNNGSKGAWVQLLAATSSKTQAVVFGMNIQQTGGNIYFDIGTGPAASEVAVIRDIPVAMTTNVGIAYIVVTVPIVIPSGTRISARAQADFAAVAIGVTLCVLE